MINYHLRKQVYGTYEPWSLLDVINKNIGLGFYDPEILELYTEEEINIADSYINHSRDENIAYVGMEQFRGKYLVQNRATGIVYETPQIAYMMIALTLFSEYTVDRMRWVRDFYNAVRILILVCLRLLWQV